MERSTKIRNSFKVRSYDETSSEDEGYSSSAAQWIDKIRLHITASKDNDKLSSDLNALLDHGVIPETEKAKSRLLRECLDLDLPKGQIRALLANLPLTCLDIDFEMATDKAVSMLLVAKPEKCKISNMKIRGNDWREEHIHQLRRLINGSDGYDGYHPETLIVCSVGFTKNKFKQLGGIVRQAESIKRLTLNYGAQSVATYPLQLVKDSLYGNVHLDELRIIRMNLSKSTHKTLAKIVFDERSHVSKLMLSRCHLDSGCWTPYGERLRADDRIKQLYIYANPLGLAGCNGLISDLKNNTSLNTLCLNSCEVDDSLGALKIDELVQVKGLRILSLTGNRLTDRSIVPMAAALAKNTYLQDLNLRTSKTYAGKKSFAALCDALSVNKSLISLKLPWFSEFDMDMLRSVFDSNFNLCQLYCPNFDREQRELVSGLLGRNQQLLRNSRVAFASGALQYVHEQRYPDVHWNQEIFVNMAEVIYSEDGWQAGSLAFVNRAALDRAQEAQRKWEDMRLQRLK